MLPHRRLPSVLAHCGASLEVLDVQFIGLPHDAGEELRSHAPSARSVLCCGKACAACRRKAMAARSPLL